MRDFIDTVQWHTHTRKEIWEKWDFWRRILYRNNKKIIREKENERYASFYYYISVENLSFFFLFSSSKKTSTDLEKNDTWTLEIIWEN